MLRMVFCLDVTLEPVMKRSPKNSTLQSRSKMEKVLQKLFGSHLINFYFDVLSIKLRVHSSRNPFKFS